MQRKWKCRVEKRRNEIYEIKKVYVLWKLLYEMKK